jgi:WD40 repeat protein
VKLDKTKSLSLPTGVLGLALAADGKRLFAACMDGSVVECETSNGKQTPFANRHTSFASGCVLTPDGKTLISAGYDGELLWHDVASRNCSWRVKAHAFWSWQLAIAPDGRRVASVSGQYLAGGEKYEPAKAAEPTVKVYETVSGELVKSFDLLPPVLSVVFSPDGRRLAAANMMGDVRVWDLESDNPPVAFNTPDFTSWGIIKSPHYCGGIYGLAFAPDGRSILACGMGPMGDPMAGNGKMTWQRWDWAATPPNKLGQIGESGAGLMEVITHAPDGTFLMAGRQAQGTWNVAHFAADGKQLGSLDTKSRVTRASFTPDGRILYLAAAVGQPKRTDGKWPDYGRIHVVSMFD